MSLGPISSVRATARYHAVSLWLWQRFNARRKLASVTCPEAPASDCLAEAAGWLCCRNGHESDDCRAAVELSERGQVRADEPILPCRHASHAAFDAKTCFRHKAYVRQLTQAGELPAGNSSTNLSESAAVMPGVQC